MGLKAVVDNLDGLEESVSSLYVERNGKFWLDVDPVGGVELDDVSKLKNSLSAARAERDEAKTKLKPFSKIEDPEAALEALEKVKDMADWDPDKEVAEKVKAREAQLIKAHEADLAKANKRGENAEGQLKDVLVKNAAMEAIQAAGGKIKLLLPHVLQSVRMKQNDNGVYITEVVGEDGLQRIGDSQGNPITIPQFVDELKGSEDFDSAFNGTGSSGSGAGGEGRKQTTTTEKKTEADEAGFVTL